jgi:hypothetical protein
MIRARSPPRLVADPANRWLSQAAIRNLHSESRASSENVDFIMT